MQDAWPLLQALVVVGLSTSVVGQQGLFAMHALDHTRTEL